MQNQTTMTKVKDCKHSIPFKSNNPDAPVSTIYLGRSWLAGRSDVVQIWDETQVTFAVGKL